MGAVTVEIWDATGNKKVNAELPDDEQVNRILILLIDKMNHIFRLVDGDSQANIATYSKSELPISEELVKSVVGFTLQK